jgi:hypothetical protein
MADHKAYEHEYMTYMNEMADLLSQCDGVRYEWYNVPAMEKRLLGAQPAPTLTVRQHTQTQPVNSPTQRPTRSRLGAIVSGFDD